MAHRKHLTIAYKRKREQKTNYSSRLKLLLSRTPRLVARFTNQRVIAQVILFSSSGDKVDVAVDSSTLRKFGWNYSLKNIPASYLTGLLVGKKALQKGCSTVIFDTGFKTPLQKGKVYAFLKGVVDSGLEVPYEGELFPEEGRLAGKHIEDYAQKLMSKPMESGAHQFTEYLKRKAQPEEITVRFRMVKQKIEQLK